MRAHKGATPHAALSAEHLEQKSRAGGGARARRAGHARAEGARALSVEHALGTKTLLLVVLAVGSLRGLRLEVVVVVGDRDARESVVVVDGEEHRLRRQVGVEVHVIVEGVMLLLRDLIVRLGARAGGELDAARGLEGVLDLDECLRAVREQVGHLAREDAHDAEQEVSRDTECHRHTRVLDVLDGLRDICLDDLDLGHLLVHVRSKPNLAERALFRQHQLRAEGCFSCQGAAAAVQEGKAGVFGRVR